MPEETPSMMPCVLCYKSVFVETQEAEGLFCARCTERVVNRWGCQIDQLPVSDWMARHDFAALCVFWRVLKDPPGGYVPCDHCTSMQALSCNVPVPVARDPEKIVLGWCRAYGCCCDGNQIVDPARAGDGLHFRCDLFRRLDELRGGTHFRSTTK